MQKTMKYTVILLNLCNGLTPDITKHHADACSLGLWWNVLRQEELNNWNKGNNKYNNKNVIIIGGAGSNSSSSNSIKMKSRVEEYNPQEKELMYSVFAPHLLRLMLNPSPSNDWCLLVSFPLVYILGIHGTEYPFGQFRSLVQVMLSHNFLCSCSPAEHRKLKSSWLKPLSTA